ncbi:MAG TPA: hypothetical protein VFS16_06645 [Acidimicrobiia bacterium]|nr:hypothetical protein [Acidimicrobiia bacterium]
MGVALVAAGFAAPSPAGAATETTFDETCADVYGKRAVGDLDKTTDPPPGSTVTSGQRVTVTLQWPTFAVAGQRAHRVMECLSIDGEAPQLWAERRFTSAEGTVSFSAAVPNNLGAKSTVCGQSFLKTEGSFGPVTRRSEKTCYPAGKNGSFTALARSPSPPAERSAPEKRSTPTTRAPLFSPPSQSPSPSPSPSPPSGSEEFAPPWPPWEKAPRVSASPPATTVTTTAALESTPTTRKSAAAEEVASPATAPTSAPSNALPRTGAGVVVLIGIAAVALFSGRTLRRASYVIEDHLPVEAVPYDDLEDDPTLVLGRRWY